MFKLLFLLCFLSAAVFCRGDNDDWRDVIPAATKFLDCINLAILLYDVDEGDRGDSRWEKEGFVPMIFMDVGLSTEFTLSFKNQTLFLAFRGSDDTQDLWDNLDTAFTSYSPPNTTMISGGKGSVAPDDAMVHRGFYNKLFGNEYFMTITEQIFQHFIPNFPAYDLVLTGHSQGAAVATLYGAYLAARMPERQVSVLNFGSPRLSNAAWKDWIQEELTNLAIFRFVYEEDFVPRLPLYSADYRHVGHLLYKFEHDDRQIKAYYQQTGQGEYDGIDDYEWDIDFNILDPLDSITDHRDVTTKEAIVAAIDDSQFWPTGFETTSAPECCWQAFGRCFRWC
mmetsp:Transcript_21945/g.36292  ORF Transcript_21945/g.36292 Transcript_21945/m.36292 type:complete len:338 (+) Transcript_21945:76-1089(+)